MNILVTGSTGLVGSHLVPELRAHGHQVARLVRTPASGEDEIRWDPAVGELDADRLRGFDAVVHLAGESVAGGRWTRTRMDRIRDSRIVGTGLLVGRLASLAEPPPVFVCASAIGFYGNRGDQQLTEDSPPGTGFLADVCLGWEAACEPMRGAGARVVNLRIGMVLSPKGGALGKMLTPFRLGIGGVFGDGKQYVSWLSIDDMVAIIEHCLACSDLRGPVNAVSPGPVTNREFTKTLGRVLGRPTVLPIPAFAARLALGRMAQDLVLDGARVLPARLTATGFEFAHEHLEGALRQVLGCP